MSAPDPRELVNRLGAEANYYVLRLPPEKLLRAAAAALSAALDRAEKAEEALRGEEHIRAGIEESRDNWRASEYSERHRAERAETRVKELEGALQENAESHHGMYLPITLEELSSSVQDGLQHVAHGFADCPHPVCVKARSTLGGKET